MSDDSTTEITALREMVEKLKKDKEDILNTLGTLLDFTADYDALAEYQKSLESFKKYTGETK